MQNIKTLTLNPVIYLAYEPNMHRKHESFRKKQTKPLMSLQLMYDEDEVLK